MSSFIYDDQDLINELIKLAQDLPAPRENVELPEAQTAQNPITNLLKLINGLQSHINPQREGVIYHEGDVTNRPSLTSTNLESLGDLLRFLSSSKIIMDGKRIAYNSDEEKQVGQGYKFYSSETHTYSEPMRGDANKGFYINPELLRSYVVYLQSYNANNPQPGMDIMLKSLISEINKSLNLGMQDYKQQAAPVLADNTVLDNTPKDFNGTTADLAMNGPVELNYGNVKDLNEFRKWMSGNQITTKSQNKQVTIQDPSFNECMVLGSLAQRAGLMARQPMADEQQRIKVEVYQKQIAAIGKQAQCPVFGGSGQQGQSGASSSAIISEIIDSPPLSQSDIDFGRINSFFTKLETLMAGTQPIISKLKSDVEAEMATVAQHMTNGSAETSFRIGAASDLNAKIRVQNQNVFQIVVGLLDKIVTDTGAALNYFRNAYGNRDQKANKFVAEQIGSGNYDTSSIYYSNKQAINQWRNTPVVVSNK
jgi:hypothetical protein